ncbi:MAG: phosphoglycerate dehydrogenase [Anaerolineae bacterium]
MTAYRILITDELSPQALERLETAAEVTFDVVRRPSREKLCEIIPDYDAIIIRSSVRIDADLLPLSSRLKVIGRAGMGLDNVDIDAASLRGVIVMNTPGANTIATTEHAIAMLLALCRHIPQADASLRAGEWARSRFIGVQLYRKTLGIVGLGRIGAQVARRTQAFGMTVIAFDPYISDDVARELNVTLVDMDELLARSDFITLHTALTPETRGMINARAIARMKQGVRLVNCARGGLLDEAALVAALRSGHIAGAALDVFADEPLPADSPLRSLPNVILTPHIAASTVEAQRDVGTQIVDQVLAALRGEDFRNAVNMPVVDAGVFQLLKPYLQLAEKLGSLQMQLSEGRIKRVEVEFQGEEVADHVKPLTVALLKGLLDPITDTPVNYISAPHLAMQRGISVSETRGLPTPNYANLLSCRVLWDQGERLVSGSLLGHEFPRVVQIDDFRIDAQPEGIVLVMESIDMPGVIGQVGTLLGAHGINIAEWRLGRIAAGGQALSFINLDTPAPANVLAELVQLQGVNRVRQVTL